MALASGTRVGGFEVVEPLGSGGMGDVYRARDLKLGRDVAIKMLSDDVVWSDERLERFEREAHVLAALNHPGIATLYGLESSESGPFLIMELVEGETLAARLSRDPLSIEEALSLFHQIAEALEFAHGKNILHRDLKPANVMVTPEARAKLLDFGLAKVLLGDGAETGDSHSPTLTRGTGLGVILGTAAYMSPEQARGKSVDARSDVFSFGAVLYEAVTGERAFRGETVTDVLAAIVGAEPDWSALPSQTPERLRGLLSRCLRKDVRKRVQHIGDVRIALEEAKDEDEAVPSPDSRQRRAPWLLAAAAALLSALATWSLMRGESPRVPVTRTTIELAPGTALARGVTPSVAISPDGRTVAYAAVAADGIRHLYLRSLDALGETRVPDSEGAEMPFFSSDGAFIGFSARATLWRVPRSGGAPTPMLEGFPNIRGASWGSDDRIVLTFGNNGPEL